MTIAEMHLSFKLELDKTSSLELPAYEPEEIDFWLNNAIRKFVKTRYSGLNTKGESIEQSQKRIDDLRKLITQESLTCSLSTFRSNTYIASLSELSGSYWFALSEEVLIAYIGLLDSNTTNITVPAAPSYINNLITGNIYNVISGSVYPTGIGGINAGEYFIATTGSQYTGGPSSAVIGGTYSSSIEPVKETTSDTLTTALNNPYSEHIFHYEKASPLRLFLGNSVELITDSNYGVVLYNLRYLKQPATVSLSPVVSCDLSEHTHDEIVRLAVNMALENIEQPRYQSHMNEIVTME